MYQESKSYFKMKSTPEGRENQLVVGYTRYCNIDIMKLYFVRYNQGVEDFSLY